MRRALDRTNCGNKTAGQVTGKVDSTTGSTTPARNSIVLLLSSRNAEASSNPDPTPATMLVSGVWIGAGRNKLVTVNQQKCGRGWFGFREELGSES